MAGRHFGFLKTAGRHQKGAGRRALQKRPRQNTALANFTAPDESIAAYTFCNPVYLYNFSSRMSHYTGLFLNTNSKKQMSLLISVTKQMYVLLICSKSYSNFDPI